MAVTLQRRLSDSEFRQQLESRNTVFFIGGCVELQEVERQVERLGFEELYIVSAVKGRRSPAVTVGVKPVSAVAYAA
jgi:hypothetical protein